MLEAPARLDDVRRQLDEYFAGRRDRFDIPVDFGLVRTDFGRRVLQATAQIPFGQTGTYASVAGGAGNASAVRAAGTALGRNPIPIVVPCHRVLRTGGALGGYTGGVEKKERLLALEGARPERRVRQPTGSETRGPLRRRDRLACRMAASKSIIRTTRSRAASA